MIKHIHALEDKLLVANQAIDSKMTELQMNGGEGANIVRKLQLANSEIEKLNEKCLNMVDKEVVSIVYIAEFDCLM